MSTNTQATNITWHKAKVSKQERQQLNGHKSAVLWFTGLSGAGKSTLAVEVKKELYRRGINTYILDGDNIRHGMNKNLGFSPEGKIVKKTFAGSVRFRSCLLMQVL